MSSAPQLLPTVQWGAHQLTRLLVGHNPVKGHSHFTPEMNQEMREWYDPALGNDLALMRRCEECGINTAQFGGKVMHDLLRRYKAQGGNMQWIATFYNRFWDDKGQTFEEELDEILAVDPKPIGLQMFGENVDRYFITDRLGELREKLKRLRDTGLLIGVGTHLPEVIETVEAEGWDVDFYQCCAYTVYTLVSSREINREGEVYEDAARERMLDFVGQASKPCIVFKILGANRKTGSPAEVRAALAYAYSRIKPTDVAIVGMWQKYRDQVGENTQMVREILGRS